MSLLSDIISEIAATGSTGATAVAATPAQVFTGRNATSKKKTKMIKRIPAYESANRLVGYSKLLSREGTINKGGILNLNKPRSEGQSVLQYTMSVMSEDITGATDFDVADVLSKLEAAEKKAKVDKDTVTFGLENEDGGIVRVYVRKDQGEEFEQALSQMLAGSDSDKDNENTSLEIAEVLFKLKDRYDIVDVDWGDIPEDEEQEQQVDDPNGAGGQSPTPADGTGGQQQPGQEGGENPIDQANAEGGESPEGGEDMGMGGEEGGDEDSAKSALDQVIDLMKADAKAKMAEAEARAAEARAKEAEWTAKASAAKVKQEEEVLDMETHEKEIQKQEKEAKRLAKLAKYRHDKASKYSGELHGSPDAEQSNPDQTMNDDQLSQVNSEENEESGGTHVPYDPALKYKGQAAGDKNRVSLEQLRDMVFYHLKGVNK